LTGSELQHLPRLDFVELCRVLFLSRRDGDFGTPYRERGLDATCGRAGTVSMHVEGLIARKWMRSSADLARALAQVRPKDPGKFIYSFVDKIVVMTLAPAAPEIKTKQSWEFTYLQKSGQPYTKRVGLEILDGPNLAHAFSAMPEGVDSVLVGIRARKRQREESAQSLFISHATVDMLFVKRLHADLQSRGLRCWFAPEDLKTGDKFQNKIERAIRRSNKILIVLSKASVESTWVGREVSAALECEQRQRRTALFPIRIDDAVMRSTQPWAAEIRRTRHNGDFRDWSTEERYRKALKRLLRDVREPDKQGRRGPNRAS
jgi:hypothetical protein